MTFSTVRQLTAEERVHKCVVDIMDNKRYVALAGLLVMGEREVRDDLPTAATNGRDEYYGRAFVEELTDPELRYIVLHENYHKLFRHLHTWKHLYDKDAKCANMACDYVINLQISEDNAEDKFATMPLDKTTGEVMGLIDTRFRSLNAQQVFDIIYEESQEQPDNQQGGDDQQDGGGGFDEHDWDGAADMSAEETEELAEQIDTAIRQGVLAAGKMGGEDTRAFEALLQPEIDWRDVMREFATTTCTGADYSTYARPNRRYMHTGMYLPSGVSEQVEELVFAIDTSMSITQEDITKFLSEAAGIVENVNPRAVRILYWGTTVCGDELYGDGHADLSTFEQSTKPIGGGGTDVTCVTEYMAGESITAQAVIVFTDGYLGSDWGTWDVPVLWCILDNQSANPPNGTTVNINNL